MNSKVICVVMGGGQGSRLLPLTDQRCKPAVPLAGKYRLVDIPISNCLNSGYNQIYVLSQFKTASLHRHIQEAYRFDPFGGGFVDILSAEQTEDDEQWYQGTSDAVRQNLHHFGAGENDLFLILSGDQLYRMNFGDIVKQHRESGADVTIAAKPVDAANVQGLGVMRVADDLSITEFVEKPEDPNVIDGLVISETLKSRLSEPRDGGYCLASMGIYVFNKTTLFNALETSSAADFGREIIPGLLGKVGLYSYLFDGFWEDIGTVRAFFDANLSLTQVSPPFNFFDPEQVVYTRARYLPASKINRCHIEQAIVADGCIITDATLKRCVIGVRSFVGEGSSLEDVVMMGQDYYESTEEQNNRSEGPVPHLGVGRNCHIKKAIIDKDARIGDDVRLSPDGKPDMFTQGDVVVRDGVLIVTKKGIVPNGTVI
jgi:glucose-1-phosphate adenylyltransferase